MFIEEKAGAHARSRLLRGLFDSSCSAGNDKETGLNLQMTSRRGCQPGNTCSKLYPLPEKP